MKKDLLEVYIPQKKVHLFIIILYLIVIIIKENIILLILKNLSKDINRNNNNNKNKANKNEKDSKLNFEKLLERTKNLFEKLKK